ncbi:hypothetical protein ES707_14089 [subsurface metagenome]
MAYGDIAAVIDSFEFDTSHGGEPEIIHIAGDVYAIVYCDAGTESRLKTVEITADGQITEPVIDDLVVHASRGISSRIKRVSGNIYVIASRDGEFRSNMATVEILPNGQIGAAPIDSCTWTGSSSTFHAWARISNTIVALAFTGPDLHGLIQSFEIGLDGTITKAAIDTWEFDTPSPECLEIVQVHGGIFALVYQNLASHGWVKTFSVDPLGEISDTEIDSLEFAPVQGLYPWLTRVKGNIYAMPCRGPDGDGWIYTVSITEAGVINAAVIDSMEFDAAECDYTNSISLGGNLVVVAYQGPDVDGWLKTIEISDAGAITDPPLSIFEFDDDQGTAPSMIRIAGDVYAIAYTGGASHGWLKTIGIESPREERADHGPMMGIGP